MKKLKLFFVLLFFSISLVSHVWATSAHIPWDMKLNIFNYSDRNLTFKDFKGKILLVNFFATYCPPCQVELYEFANLYPQLKPKGVEIISFMVDEGGERLLPHLIHSKNIKYYVAVADEKVLSAFGWPDILPTTFLVDRDGKIVRKFVGFAGTELITKELDKLLQKQTENKK